MNAEVMYGIHIFNLCILGFAVLIMSSYLILSTISIFTLRRYKRSNDFVDYDVILASEMAPALSLIAPAYNEGKTIIENVSSLLSLNYSKFEVIVVNDGSKDDSMAVLTEYFQLERSDEQFTQHIATKEVKGVYRSKNPAFKKLVVVDKFNGGKADALNVGINVSGNPYIVCIDVDCVLDKNTLLILAKPFLEDSSKRVIATGGVVRIANSCIVKNGRLVETRAPEKLLPRVQVIEYLRAFLLGRMAWERIDGLLLISGAFGLFDKEIVIKVGGYNHRTVGEDMELVVRMRRHMVEQKEDYIVSFLPDPVCWTEAPESFNILRKQRSRWTRGTMETLWIHRRMLFNPKYGILGLISVPYWVVFEYLAPIIEFLGLLITVLFVIWGIISWKFFLLLVLFVYTFAVMFSMLALLTEEYLDHQYPKMSDFRKLFLVALIEPFYFHPFIVYSALRGNWEKITGIKGWGDMVRTGFDKKQ